jgi:hypothetical protein
LTGNGKNSAQLSTLKEYEMDQYQLEERPTGKKSQILIMTLVVLIFQKFLKKIG